jgi:hypothetical protein
VKRLLLFVAICGPLVAQTLPVWSASNVISWVKIGNTLAVTNGVLDVVPVAPPKPTRLYGVSLTAGANGTYTISTASATLSNVVVYVNGLRYHSPKDYTISGAVITPTPPATNWPTIPDVFVDYDP